MTQFVDCYDYTNQGGQKIHVQDYTPALRTINFDNRIESCCFTGVWLLYDLENYGQGSLNSMDWWVYGNNYCANVPAQFSNRASSLRFTGAPNDWNYDTINMYFICVDWEDKNYYVWTCNLTGSGPVWQMEGCK